MIRLLEGVVVADFTWIGAGAYATKMLADLGAEVIKVETPKHLDSLRVSRPFKDGIPGTNRSGYFADRNSSKLGIGLELKHPRGLELAKRLIARADIVANNFTPGVMDRLGLGYDVVRAIDPRIVYMSMSMQGAYGPDRDYLGYGLTIGALTGFQHLTGLPDREPAGTGTNYPDHIPNPCHAAFVVLAALRHARRTGEGQHIDLSQIEAPLATLGPWIANCSVNGVVDGRRGNTHPQMSPHGVYPCEGEDRWIAIAVTSDAQWALLASILGIDASKAWATMAGRIADQANLDRAVAARTRHFGAATLAAQLQAAKIPAGPVQDARDILQDPQLAGRAHWVTLDHPEMGPSIYNAPPFRFSGAEHAPSRPAPLMGQHTRRVCEDILGLSPAEVDSLFHAGAVS